MSDDNLRAAAGQLLGGPVEIWPACAPDLAPGECTPENYAHLKARLADAADNLAREVRSNQAALLVRADFEARIRGLEQQVEEMSDERHRLASDLAAALSELDSMHEREESASLGWMPS